MPHIEVIRAADRFTTTSPGVRSQHVFSFGGHYDPTRVAAGPLRAVNDETLQPGAGFDAHQHRDLEIVTWVVTGALEHADSLGHRGLIRPGTVQRLSAGTGVTHTERNAAASPGGEAVRFIQMWVDAEVLDPPEYADAVVEPSALDGGWVVVASGSRATGALVSLRNDHASLLATRLAAGGAEDVVDGGRIQLVVVTGTVSMVCDDEDVVELAEGDTALVDGADPSVSWVSNAELLAWLVD